MKDELKKYLDKEDKELLAHFRWSTSARELFKDFMNLVREELNYYPNYNFIRMINNETGEVKQTNACEEGFEDLYKLIENNYLEHITFEGNEYYVKKLSEHLRYLFLKYQ